MAKNSNKHRVLERRKQELDHALKQKCSQAVLRARAEKLRVAAIALLKKHGGSFRMVKGTHGHSAWMAMRARWEALTADEIVALASRWGSRPTIRNVEFRDGLSERISENAESGDVPPT